MGDLVLLDQPKTMEVRCEIARQFVDDTNYLCPLVVDTMANQFDENFGAWPVRFWIVENNHLVYKAQPQSDHTYDLDDVRRWLEARFT